MPRLPITRREMTVIWRNLRRLQREGVPEELDIQGTINQICQMGCFLNPVLQPRRKNQVKLVLLIDREGSMSPFNLLMEALQASVEKGGLLHNTSVYYFHNCPRGYIFPQPNLTKPDPIEEILSKEAYGNSVVIISDAGAARRTYNSERFNQTQTFIKRLRRYTYLYGWLNPVPKFQWRTTTAEDIATIVPMYPINREGLNDLVKILLGYPFPTGVGL
ncbi:MAG: VWA domain-containing protein [Moorea sp. SIO4A3]|nr:VWA domain-containing protein [Moorena sp. SIO4A3]